MSGEALKAIASAMEEMGLRYGYVSYDQKPLKYPYYTGEYTEVASTTEDGLEEGYFTLTGYGRRNQEELEAGKAAIRRYCGLTGRTMMTASGGLAIMYESGRPIPTWDEDLKRMEIILRIKEWRSDVL